MHAGLIEAVPTGALCALAKSLQVALAIVFEHIVLAGDVEHRQRKIAQYLLQRVELGQFGQVREIAGVQNERRRFGRRLDLRDQESPREQPAGLLAEADDGGGAHWVNPAPLFAAQIRSSLESPCSR